MPEFTLPPDEFDSIFERRYFLGPAHINESCTAAGAAPSTSRTHDLQSSLHKHIQWQRDELGLAKLKAVCRRHRLNPFAKGRRLRNSLDRRQARDAKLAQAQHECRDVTCVEQARQLISKFDLQIHITDLPDEIVFAGERLPIGARLFYVEYWGADLPIIETFHVVGYRFHRLPSGTIVLDHRLRSEGRREEDWNSVEIAELRAGTFEGRWSNKKAFLDETAAREFAVRACEDWIAALRQRQEIFGSAEPLPTDMSIWRDGK